MWQNEIAKGIKTAKELAAALNLSEEQAEVCDSVTERYPMMIPPYYLSLIDRSDPNDPIAKMCLPSGNEFAPDGDTDTSGEASNTKIEGLQHKYAQTALILSTNRCAMYCRHCFRKRMVGLSVAELTKRADEAVAYVAAHPEISSVLISGGDALMNTNAVIKQYLDGFSRIDTLDFIRIGTRMPVVLPERIYGDEELLELFSTYSKQKTIWIVTQFNHPRELTEEAQRAIQALQNCNVQVRNQTVLLRGVNDDAETLGELLKGLTSLGVVPYYIFQCRPVKGVKGYFQVPIDEGIAIVDKAKSMQNGFGRSVRFCMSHPLGKIEIIGKADEGQTMFKFHQNKYPEDAARIFTATLSPQDTWLDEELNGTR